MSTNHSVQNANSALRETCQKVYLSPNLSTVSNLAFNKFLTMNFIFSLYRTYNYILFLGVLELHLNTPCILAFTSIQ